MSRRIDVIRDKNILYKDFINLSDDYCVMVRRSDFYFWMARVGLLKNKHFDIMKVFSKYIGIDNMKNFINDEDRVTGYYLMSVLDVKLILNCINYTNKNSVKFVKSDVKVEELNNYHEEVRKQFVKKRNKYR